MKPSGNALRLIKQFEGLRLRAYLDQVTIPTIGYGSTRYPDGAKVQMGDKIDVQKADAMLYFSLQGFASRINDLIKSQLNQNQFDALCSFTYNVGGYALEKSTLLKKINKDPNDPSIEMEFLRWCKAKGQVLPGLKKRRQAESDFYFSD